MKANISVPDDLWATALAQSAVGSSPSAVVQDALRRVTTAADPSSALDDETAALFHAALEKVRRSAEAAYDGGYRSGLRVATEVGDWSRLREIEQLGIVAAIQESLERAKAELAAGTYPTHGILFVKDRRTEPDDVEVTVDENGDETYWDPDPDAHFLRSIEIQADGTLIHGDPKHTHPLLVKGAEAALRDVLSAATPSSITRKS